ncbi:MAG: TonB-dependent receptor [Bacteroidetes bacterium]|nr:TonB-dependent receptor [Bacteroidota bacterium]
MKLKGFSILLFCLLVSLLKAQVKVQGKVIDGQLNLPVFGAIIYQSNGEFLAETNLDGQFSFIIKSGVYNLKINAFGFQLLEQELNLNADTNFVWVLDKLSQNLDAAIIVDRNKELVRLKRLRAVDGTAIYAGKKTEVALIDGSGLNLANNNARELYSQISGLNIFEGNAGGLQLCIGGRGLDPNRTANFNTRQNGYDISADVLGYPESYYTPPAEALEEVQVVRGAASLQYGTQFGGLVNFKMKQPNPFKKFEYVSRQTLGSFNNFSSFNSVSGTVGKFSYYSYFNYKTGDGFRPNSHFDSKNAFAHLGYKFSNRTRVNLESTYLHYLAQQPGGLTDAQFYSDPTFSNRTRNWFQVNWRMLSLKLEHKFSVNSQLSINAYGLNASREAIGFRTNRVSQADDLSAPRDLIVGQFRNWGTEARFITRYKLFNKPAAFLVGTKVYHSNNTSQQGAGSSGTDADFAFANEEFPQYAMQSGFRFPNRNVAIFAEQVFWLTSKLTLTPGIRYEYIKTQSIGHFRAIDFDLAGNVIRDQTFADNRTLRRGFALAGLGIGFKPNECAELYGNISQNYRSVTFNDVRIVNPSYQIDPNISDEHGFTIDAGMRGLCNKFLSYDVGAFAMFYNDRIGEVLRAETRIDANGNETQTGRIVRYRGNIGSALVYGLEMNTVFNLKQWWFKEKKHLKLDWFANTAITHSRYTESEINGVKGNNVEFVPLVNLKTGVKFGYKNLLANVQLVHLSKQYSDASNAEQQIWDNQRGIEGTIPAYQVVDFSLSYQYKRFKVETGINNLLDQNYFTRRATGYPGPGIIPSDPRTGYVTLEVKI